MKVKYFLRGLGTGILIATLLLFCVYSYKMSDSKIVERAKALGMEYSKNNSNINATEDLSQTSTNTEESSDKKEESTTLPKQESTSETSQMTSASEEIIEVSISAGMNSESVSEVLQAAGIIDSARDFNNYLIQNNMGRYIKSGEYQLKSGMSYAEIANILQKGW